MEELSNCPACNSSEIIPSLEGFDFFLTKEKFSIWDCRGCGLKFTNPRPIFSEMSKYYESSEYISHDSGQKGVLTRIYKVARKFTLKRKFAIIHKYSKTGSILDVGCATGEFLNHCRGKEFSVYGVEPNEKPRKWAIDHFQLDIRKNLNDFQAGKFQFNCITLWHVLEHIHDLQGTILNLTHLLAPGGIIIIALPNLNAWDARHYGKFWAALDLPRHLYHFNSGAFTLLAKRKGLKIINTLPQSLDSFYISLLSEKYQFGKTNYLKVFFLGLVSNIKAKKPEYRHSSLVYILEREIT